MEFRYWSIFTAFFVVFSIAITAVAADPVTTPANLSKQIVKVIPKDWRCEVDHENVIVRPVKSPLFTNINTVNKRPQDPNESDEEYERRFQFTIDDQIVLRCCPRISQTHVDELLEKNRTIMGQLEEIQKNPLVNGGRGGLWFDDSADGAALLKKYNTLRMAVSPVPRGYLGELSVYLEPTTATFLRDEDQREHSAVLGNLNRALTLYANLPANLNPVYIPSGILEKKNPLDDLNRRFQRP